MVDSIVTIANYAELEQQGASVRRTDPGNSSFLAVMQYRQVDSTYFLDYDLVLNTPGLYVLQQRLDFGAARFVESDQVNPSETADFELNFLMSDAAEANFFLLEGTMVPQYRNALIDRELSRYNDYGNFVFRVE